MLRGFVLSFLFALPASWKFENRDGGVFPGFVWRGEGIFDPHRAENPPPRGFGGFNRRGRTIRIRAHHADGFGEHHGFPKHLGRIQCGRVRGKRLHHSGFWGLSEFRQECGRVLFFGEPLRDVFGGFLLCLPFGSIGPCLVPNPFLHAFQRHLGRSGFGGGLDGGDDGSAVLRDRRWAQRRGCVELWGLREGELSLGFDNGDRRGGCGRCLLPSPLSV